MNWKGYGQKQSCHEFWCIFWLKPFTIQHVAATFHAASCLSLPSYICINVVSISSHVTCLFPLLPPLPLPRHLQLKTYEKAFIFSCHFPTRTIRSAWQCLNSKLLVAGNSQQTYKKTFVLIVTPSDATNSQLTRPWTSANTNWQNDDLHRIWVDMILSG